MTRLYRIYRTTETTAFIPHCALMAESEADALARLFDKDRRPAGVKAPNRRDRYLAENVSEPLIAPVAMSALGGAI